MLSYDGRLLMIKSVFSTLPIFFMHSLALSAGVISQLNKYLRHFLWRKFGMEESGAALVAWDKITKPKLHGGLGILNILEYKRALLMKNFHKFSTGKSCLG